MAGNEALKARKIEFAKGEGDYELVRLAVLLGRTPDEVRAISDDDRLSLLAFFSLEAEREYLRRTHERGRDQEARTIQIQRPTFNSAAGIPFGASSRVGSIT